MPDLTDAYTDTELDRLVAAAAADLHDRAGSIQTYPTTGRVQITYGEGSLEAAERLAMLLSARHERKIEAQAILESALARVQPVCDPVDGVRHALDPTRCPGDCLRCDGCARCAPCPTCGGEILDLVDASDCPGGPDACGGCLGCLGPCPTCGTTGIAP